MLKSHRICEICGVGERYLNDKLFFARFPQDKDRCALWVKAVGKEDLAYLPVEKLYDLKHVCKNHFTKRDFTRKKTRLKKKAVPSVELSVPPLTDNIIAEFLQLNSQIGTEMSVSQQPQVEEVAMNRSSETSLLEVCIDNLESARNAINGGADELEVCSSLAEGGLTPSPGLVKKILKLNAVINVMIRCRGGSDFCYTEDEMTTMLSDIEVYKDMGVNRFVFGALTDNQAIDKVNCARIIDKAHPVPVTFHRAFDVCKDPEEAMVEIIKLGFTRLLTSGQKSSAADATAVLFLKCLLDKYGEKIEIMPGAGINCDNADIFCQAGFKIMHSTCKHIRTLPNFSSLSMGGNEVYVTDENIVRKMKKIISQNKF